MFDISRTNLETTRFLIKFVCGHSYKTFFLYVKNEPKWDVSFCRECCTVKRVIEMAPAYNSKEVEL